MVPVGQETRPGRSGQENVFIFEREKTPTTAKDFAASDAIMSRCISTAIGLLWTEEQVKTKGEQIVAIVRKVIG